MLILIVFVPTSFAINHTISDSKILESLTTIEQSLQKQLTANPDQKEVVSLSAMVSETKEEISHKASDDPKTVFKFRKHIQTISKEVKSLINEKKITNQDADIAILKSAVKDLSGVTDYAPTWVIAAISIALGLGTMIGWKRIVLTIGEKIGKEHLNYAQGASAELVAATTIGLSTGFGLPVSTTQVLSSGIAGAMVASNGTKNLNNGTLKSIAMAWILTLPVTILLSLGLFFLFHLFV